MKNIKYGKEHNLLKMGIPSHICKAKVYNPPSFEKTGVRLYMNENLYGPSPGCIDSIKDIKLDNLFKYSYGRNDLIESKISYHLGIVKDNIMVSNGASDVLKLILESALEKDDIVLLPDPGWSYYVGISNLVNSKIKKYKIVEEKNRFSFNVNEIINLISIHKPKIVVITSPNMPTGNMIEEDKLEEIINSMEQGFLILDEAYYGFSQQKYNVSKLVKKYNKLIVVRTFSKLYGLASLRVGYLLCDSRLKEVFNKKSPLFGISYIAQKVAAAALDDKRYYDNLAKKVQKVRKEFIKNVDELDGFYCFESQANFLLIKLTKFSAESITEYLKTKGYLLRNCKGYGLKDYIRISIGKEEQMHEVHRLLRDYIRYESSGKTNIFSKNHKTDMETCKSN